MPFSLLDLEKSGTCGSVNFTHLAYVTLLYYLLKVETPKMHVNINSSFNIDYKTAIKGTKLR